jgi:hypothetical protein
MKPDQAKDIPAIFREGTLIEKAVRKAVAQALRVHKALGNPVAEWRDGKVVWVRPEDIPLTEEPPDVVQ